MRGKLTQNGFAQTMPVHADPLSFTNASFRGVNQVTFSYRTNADAAAGGAGHFPPQRIGRRISAANPQIVKALGLRVVGSAVPGGPLAVCELVPSALEFSAGEIWSGDGSPTFTGASAFSAVHQLPITGAVEAIAFYNSAFRLRRPTETYPFDA